VFTLHRIGFSPCFISRNKENQLYSILGVHGDPFSYATSIVPLTPVVASSSSIDTTCTQVAKQFVKGHAYVDTT
jgi:hypothetical protein